MLSTQFNGVRIVWDEYLDGPSSINTRELACRCTVEQAFDQVEKISGDALRGSRTAARIIAFHVDHAIRLGQLV